jgi:hypothetical protein
MEVKFENGKTIIDGVPALLYINEKGHGVGQIYKNGEKLTGLQKVSINAETDTFTTYDVRLAVIRNKAVIAHCGDGSTCIIGGNEDD